MSQENLYTPGCIRTFTGKYFNPCNPEIDLICIEDIAHALSMQTRFGGHLPVFYSVAQHCVLAAREVSDEYRLTTLLHDASEAYLIDVPRPVKEQLSNYKEIEHRLMKIIAAKFSIAWPLPEWVKIADEYMLRYEWQSLMLNDCPQPPIEPWEQQLAEAQFLAQFHKLTHY